MTASEILIRDGMLAHQHADYVMWGGTRCRRTDMVVIGDRLYCDVADARRNIVNTLWEMNRSDDHPGLFEFQAMAGEFNRKYPERAIEQREVIPTPQYRSGKPHSLEALHGSTSA
jgi:hypothetical protein